MVEDKTLCQEGAVRLVNGLNKSSGRVEVCVDNSWGTVCDDGFDNVDASIICKQLNFSSIGEKRYITLVHDPLMT